MAIKGGFGMRIDLTSGFVRRWTMGGDGTKRWLDTGAPCDDHSQGCDNEDCGARAENKEVGTG